MGPFKKHHSGGKAGARKPSDLLKDMRAVYRGDVTKETPARKNLKKLMEKDFERFTAMLGRLEHAFARLKDLKAGKKETSEGPDEGTERSLALLEELLAAKEWNG